MEQVNLKIDNCLDCPYHKVFDAPRLPATFGIDCNQKNVLCVLCNKNVRYWIEPHSFKQGITPPFWCPLQLLEAKQKKVFLGGTVKSNWRNILIPMIECEYYDPAIKEWKYEDYLNEISEKENADYCLYVITPKMEGVYSIAEVVNDSNKKPLKTIFCVLEEDENCFFGEQQMMVMEAIKVMVKSNGANVFSSLAEIANFLNENKL